MLKVLELFGGIGACTKALKRLGVDFSVVDYVEIDKHAVNSYNAMNGTFFKPQNISQWDKNLETDLIMHGSPCQDFSLAGLQAGGSEGSGTRSSLMWETLRIVKKLKPRYVVWENVKNILSSRHKVIFDNYLRIMESLGYDNYYKILNAKDFGIPQNRERVFVVSIRKDLLKDLYPPQRVVLERDITDILDKDVDEKYFLDSNADTLSLFTSTQAQMITSDGNIYRYIGSKVVDKFEVGDCADISFPHGYNKGNRVFKGYCPCINTTTVKSFIVKLRTSKNEERIRKITSKECWRLMGFDDEDFDKASKVCSDAQLFKQAGNSIVVDVLVAIFKNLLY